MKKMKYMKNVESQHKKIIIMMVKLKDETLRSLKRNSCNKKKCINTIDEEMENNTEPVHVADFISSDYVCVHVAQSW